MTVLVLQVLMKIHVCNTMKKILNTTTTSGGVHEILDLKDSKEMLAKTLENLFLLEITK